MVLKKSTLKFERFSKEMNNRDSRRMEREQEVKRNEEARESKEHIIKEFSWSSPPPVVEEKNEKFLNWM